MDWKRALDIQKELYKYVVITALPAPILASKDNTQFFPVLRRIAWKIEVYLQNSEKNMCNQNA